LLLPFSVPENNNVRHRHVTIAYLAAFFEADEKSAGTKIVFIMLFLIDKRFVVQCCEMAYIDSQSVCSSETFVSQVYANSFPRNTGSPKPYR
jgi:hypothetical protein